VCWPWKGGRQQIVNRAMGYGKFAHRGKTKLAHRVAYMLTFGKIPVGYTIDHRCNVPWCCNPKHLMLATMRENVLRGKGRAAVNARKTHCIRGHAFTPENTGRQKNGRYCVTCRRADWRRFNAAQRLRRPL
jgi:HNH endonuclease